MSLAVEARSSCSSKDMGFGESTEALEKNLMPSAPPRERRGGASVDAGGREVGEVERHGEGAEERDGLSKQIGEASVYTTEKEEEEEEGDKESKKLDLGPKVSLKQQLEKDKVCSLCPPFILFSFSSFPMVF